MQNIEELKKRTIYQNFEDISWIAKNSRSKEKLDAINFNPKWLTILDVWCNTWYFPIRFSQAWAKHVTWIDVDKKWWAWENVIEIANWYKEFYKINNIDFKINSIFDEEIKWKFDAVTCFSTFHYFRERQEEFFNIVNELLNEWGLLIWEWWLSQDHELEKYSRWVDEEPCYFPSLERIKEMAKWFEVIYYWKSVDQKWDKIPRFVIHFKKVWK